tara:strand:- start:712 stop:849 length:138 start_codon:yes stop_codon:yes gene_type:complete
MTFNNNFVWSNKTLRILKHFFSKKEKKKAKEKEKGKKGGGGDMIY